MCKARNKKRKSFDTNFGKMVCMVDPALGLKSFKEIQNHYDSRGEEDAKMTLEKVQILANFLLLNLPKKLNGLNGGIQSNWLGRT
jgi:hypothetical protein